MNIMLQDNIKMKIILLFISIFLGLVVSACASDIKQPTANLDRQAFALHDKLMFQEVVDLYERASKINELPPYSLILLGSALHELEYDVQKFFKKHSSEKHITEFSLAFSDLLHGKAESADTRFRKLYNTSGVAQFYGIIGLFETALFTLNHSALKELLLELEKNIAVNDKNLKQVVLYYSIMHNRLIGDMQKVTKLLAEMRGDDLQEDFELRIVEIESLISRNQIDKAFESIDDAIRKFGPIQEAVLLKYRLVSIKNGVDASKAFLDKKTNQNENMWQLELSQYFQQLDSLGGNDGSDIVRKIIAIAENLKRDLQSYLMICNGLLDYGYYIEAGNLMNTFFRNTDNQSKFFMSNVYMSKFHYSSNEEVRFNVSYSTAKQQSPRDIGFLWFQYYLATDAEDYSEASKIIDQILSFDPFDTFVLYEKMTLNANLSNWEQVVSDADMIVESRRFIESTIREEMSSLRDKALSHLNK